MALQQYYDDNTQNKTKQNKKTDVKVEKKQLIPTHI